MPAALVLSVKIAAVKCNFTEILPAFSTFPPAWGKNSVQGIPIKMIECEFCQIRRSEKAPSHRVAGGFLSALFLYLLSNFCDTRYTRSARNVTEDS